MERLGRPSTIGGYTFSFNYLVSFVVYSEGQTRHMYLVSAAYSLLMHAMYASSPHDWTRRTLRTIGEVCRAVKRELLERLVDWVVDKLADDGWSLSRIKAVLAQT